MPADNLAAAAKAFAIIDPANPTENPVAIQHGVALVNRTLEQQVNGADFDGRLYSRKATSQRNSNGGRELVVANRTNCPPPRNDGVEHSTNNGNGNGGRGRGRRVDGAGAGAGAAAPPPAPRNQ